jgi:hypothetical protein
MAGKYVLTERTSDALRKVAAVDGIDPDTLVYMWCMVATPAGEDHGR